MSILAQKTLLRWLRSGCYVHHGIELSESTVRKVTLNHAQGMYENERLHTLNGELPSEGAEVIIAEADGTMLPVVEFDGAAQDPRKSRTVKWEETKLCAAVKSGDKEPVYGFGENVEDLGVHWLSASSRQVQLWTATFMLSVTALLG